MIRVSRGSGSRTGSITEVQEYSVGTGGHVADREPADGRGPLGVEQDQQAGDAVFGLEVLVVQQGAGLVPAGFGVDDAGRAYPADRGEVEGCQFVALGPAYEVAGVLPVGCVRVCEPGFEVALPGGGERGAVLGQGVEQGSIRFAVRSNL
jgi:hypothetical protein